MVLFVFASSEKVPVLIDTFLAPMQLQDFRILRRKLHVDRRIAYGMQAIRQQVQRMYFYLMKNYYEVPKKYEYRGFEYLIMSNYPLQISNLVASCNY